MTTKIVAMGPEAKSMARAFISQVWSANHSRISPTIDNALTFTVNASPMFNIKSAESYAWTQCEKNSDGHVFKNANWPEARMKIGHNKTPGGRPTRVFLYLIK